MFIPQNQLRLLPLRNHQQAAALQQLSLISSIIADLEALARKGAKCFVLFIGNLQLQGLVSLTAMGGAEGTEEQAYFCLKETKSLV